MRWRGSTRTRVDALMLDLALPGEVLVPLLDLHNAVSIREEGSAPGQAGPARPSWKLRRPREEKKPRGRASGETVFHISAINCDGGKHWRRRRVSVLSTLSVRSAAMGRKEGCERE